MAHNLTSLPVELHIKILNHLPSNSSLLSAILSHRSLHTAYLEARCSINSSILQHSTSPTSKYCNFLTYAILIFHQKQYITLDRLHKYIKAYLSFANPSPSKNGKNVDDVVPWEIRAPPKFYETREQVHRYISLWAEKFANEHLPTNNPITAHPVTPSPASAAEVARAAKALYQYFIYILLTTDSFFHSDDVDNLGRPVTGRPAVETLGALIESMGYRDRKIITWFLKNWIVGTVEGVLGKCIADEKNPIRTDPQGRWGVSVGTLESKVSSAAQALVTRLGPIDLWKFAFESTYDEQFKVYCQAPAMLDRHSFWPWEVLEEERKEAEVYDPRLRICTTPDLKVGDGVFEWWDNEGVTKEGILWDEGRQRRMGLHWPVVQEGHEVNWYDKKGTVWREKETAIADSECYWSRDAYDM